MASRAYSLAVECMRQSESCLYTSASLFIYLRFLRICRFLFITVPLILGAIAGWDFLAHSSSDTTRTLIAVCALIAAVIPSLYSALAVEEHTATAADLAAEFKSLQDAFRVCGEVSSRGSFARFEVEFKSLMERMDAARKPSFTAPEICFRLARRKIRQEHYKFDVTLPEDFVEGDK